MRNGRMAEAILSLVSPVERAASTVGDLIEEAAARGPLWFWTSVARTALSFLGRDLMTAPLPMIVSAVFAWFLYMALSLIFVFAGVVLVTLLWGLGYVLTHHTGFELLADLLKLRFDWTPLPAAAAYSVQALVLGMAAPFQTGRFAGRYWRGHELTIWVVLMTIWPVLAVVAPFVAMGVRAGLPMMPAIGVFLLLGALWEKGTRLELTN